MYSKVCPVCKSKIYGVDYRKLSEPAVHRNCRTSNKNEPPKMERPHRTSTPISDLENNAPSGFSDSVSDFFYQSWKNGLHSNQPPRPQINFNRRFNQPNQMPQTICYAPQIFYVNQIICPNIQPPLGGYVQQVGYRPDGTYGLLPPYWHYG